MGSQIDSLLEHRYEDWVEAASEALRELKERYSPVLLPVEY